MSLAFTLLVFLFNISDTDCPECAQTITVKGVVLEHSTDRPIQGVNVYIAGSQKGTATDPNGRFMIEEIEQETFQLIFSHIGYDIRAVNFEGATTDKTLKVYLKPAETELASVTVKAKEGRKWERDLRKFKSFFFGDGYKRADITLNNDYLLEFEQGKGKGLHVVNEPALEISNQELGYDIYFQLLKFELGDTKTYLGHSLFKEMDPKDAEQQRTWKENRKLAYQGSVRHFFKSLIDQQYETEGYGLMIEKPTIDGEIYSGKLPQPKKVRFSDDGIYKQNIWIKPINEKVFELEFSGIMLVSFTKEKDASGQFQRSQIAITEPLRIHRNGVLLNPDALEMNGYWTTEGVAQSLPFEYNPDLD